MILSLECVSIIMAICPGCFPTPVMFNCIFMDVHFSVNLRCFYPDPVAGGWSRGPRGLHRQNVDHKTLLLFQTSISVRKLQQESCLMRVKRWAHIYTMDTLERRVAAFARWSPRGVALMLCEIYVHVCPNDATLGLQLLTSFSSGTAAWTPAHNICSQQRVLQMQIHIWDQFSFSNPLIRQEKLSWR